MIIVSNGFHKFHMGMAAEEAYKKGILSSYITGGYPVEFIKKFSSLHLFKQYRKFDRLLAREIKVPENLVESLWLPELISMAGYFAENRHLFNSLASLVSCYSYIEYGRYAAPIVHKAALKGAKIYHFRSGFGHQSLKIAKQQGLFNLCDHSTVHPLIFDKLVNGNGLIQNEKNEKVKKFWHDILEDCNHADAMLVNSEYVKETFVNMGYDASRIFVIYLGVDDAFINSVPERSNSIFSAKRPLQLLFAGGFIKGKGANTIIKSLQVLDEKLFEFHIAGNISDEVYQSNPAFFHKPNVKQLGWIHRSELAKKMSEADVFVFPSYVEGSARVVFEALSCGCYVITTKNSGSIVENGIHGSIIEPGNHKALADAITFALENKKLCSDIGIKNAQLVREKYKQSDYGTKLIDLYSRILQKRIL